LVKYYTDKVTIKWKDDQEFGKRGELMLGDEPLFLEYRGDKRGAIPPAYFLTHGRYGACVDVARANTVLLVLKGYNCSMWGADITPDNNMNKSDHAFLESYIDGKVYLVNFNDVIPRDFPDGSTIYDKWRWKLDKNYDSDWYQKGIFNTI